MPEASPIQTASAISGDARPGILGAWRCRAVARSEPSAPLPARVMESRGLSGPDAALFLEPSLKHLHDPSLLPGTDRAAERLLAAARGGERIVIYGDYDVDGVSASAILYHTIRAIAPGASLGCYIPHRVDEGYGLSAQAIADLAREGARVIVTVDCGISAREPARVARAAGVDLIITDHHAPPEGDLPEAYAHVHPALPGREYPYPHLCGAAVAYKLAWRLCTMASGAERLPRALRELLLELLALAALGIVADVVPLTGEHRVIARFGLGRIRGSPIHGLRALVESSGLAGDRVQADDVGFKLGPRLNACGRLGHAGAALELLTTASPERGLEIARGLARTNEERQRTEREVVEQAVASAHERGMTGPGRRAVVLADARWHTGVVGIACARLVSMHHRPVILLGRAGDLWSGSGRSVAGVHLAEALEACRGMLVSGGGHAMAAGLKLRPDSLPEFLEAFTEYVHARLPADQMVRRIEYDVDATVDELSPEAVASLDRLAPFGQGNPRVHLRLRGVHVRGPTKPLGAEGKHLQTFLGSLDRSIRTVAWGWGERARQIDRAVVDAVVVPKVSEWMGRRRVELELVDARPVA
ncbi:MAG: single-stranded-DNA-specific exonuclease RecJ [Phycisphaerae bacterium]|nr:single-stranded-DNA-specific exonuclease RecJ [Phycisphaerae bacterium]